MISKLRSQIRFSSVLPSCYKKEENVFPKPKPIQLTLFVVDYVRIAGDDRAAMFYERCGFDYEFCLHIFERSQRNSQGL